MDNKLSNIFGNQINVEDKKITFVLKIKCIYFLKQLFDILPELTLLKIIRYNKKIKDILGLNVIDYKKYYEKKSSIEVHINFFQDFGKFINIDKENKKYYHIFIDDQKNEEVKLSAIEKIKCKKAKIIIDYQIKSFNKMFSNLSTPKVIKFTKFHRNNIVDMSHMFSNCSAEEIIFDECNTENVTNMNCMFNGCLQLKNLILSPLFNTSKVLNMDGMFCMCSSLKKIDTSNFDTNKVRSMGAMFADCFSLKELDRSL